MESVLKYVSKLLKPYYLTINFWSTVVLVLVSFVLGLFIYQYIMISKQEALMDAYLQSDVICNILSENPQFAQGQCRADYKSSQLNDLAKKQVASDSPFSIDVLSYLYEKADLYDPDEIDDPKQLLDEKEMPGTAFLTLTLMGDDPEESRYLKLGEKSSLQLIDHLAQKLGDQGCTGGDEQASSILVKKLAMGMSQVKPKDKTPMQALQEPCEFKDIFISGAVWEANKDAVSDNDLLSYLWTVRHANRAELVYSSLDKTDQWTYSLDKLTKVNLVSLNDSGELKIVKDDAGFQKQYQPDDKAKKEIYEVAMKFSQFLMGKIHSTDNVAEKRKALVMYRGYEQQLMLCLLIFVLLVIFVRFLGRKGLEHLLRELEKSVPVIPETEKKVEDYRRAALSVIGEKISEYDEKHFANNIVYKACIMVKNKLSSPLDGDTDKMRNALTLDTERLYNSRWIVRWTAITIPAIGFVGTVRGILQSLSQADVIVWASTQSERAAAIGEISGELGLAFATTLIALVIGIGISIFNEHQSKNESDFVFMLEETLSKYLDYRYQGVRG